MKQHVEWRRYGGRYSGWGGIGGWELHVNGVYRGVVSVVGNASSAECSCYVGSQPLAAQALLEAVGVKR